MKILIFLISTCIIVVPTFNIVGLPLRVEDLFYVGILFRIRHLKFINSLTEFDSKCLRLLVLFFLSSMLSLLFYSISSGYTIIAQDVNTLISLVKICIVFYIGLWLGYNSKSLDSNELILILSGGLFVSSILSVIQYLDLGGLGSYFFLLYGKEESMQYGISRSVGTIGNPNYAAFFQIVGLIALLSVNSKKYRILVFAGIAIVALSTILTFSRTGLLTLIFVSTCSLILRNKYRQLLTLLSLGVLFVLPNIDKVVSNTRYAIISENNQAFDVTLNGRTDLIWAEKLRFFFDNIFFGVGSAKNVNGSGTNLFSFTVFDNSYLYLLVTTGVIGVALYFAFLYFQLRFFTKQNNAKVRVIRHFVILLNINILLFFITTDLVKNIYFISYFYLLIGVLIAYYRTQNPIISLKKPIQYGAINNDSDT